MKPISGLYAITPEWPTAELLAAVAAAVEGGASLVQYRNKRGTPDERRHQAQALAVLCRRLRIPLIVNDDPRLAAELEADGVHLGQDDPDVTYARRLLGQRAMIGVSCYDDLARARAAQELGADYVAFGSFFPSTSKPHARRAAPELLQQARNALKIPVVAIGGLTPDRGRILVEHGAQALAVIQALFEADDIAAAARRFAALFA